MTTSTTINPQGFGALRVIPIVQPGTNAFSFAIALTEEAETAARESAAAKGLRAGAAMTVEPNPYVSAVLDRMRKARG